MIFGLIGKKLQHSFSATYFSNKFIENKLLDSYQLFEISEIQEYEQLKKLKNLRGVNVTIPYKTSIIPFLDEIDSQAAEVGAVNTILFLNGKSKGFNTDIVGFENSLLNWYPPNRTKKAVILGDGGSAKAVHFVLQKNQFEIITVCRNPDQNQFAFLDINERIVEDFPLWVQTTPVGMFPDESSLPLPFHLFSDTNYFFDLIYNPAKTNTGKLLEKQGVQLQNGLEMLYLQAEKSWEIWNEQ